MPFRHAALWPGHRAPENSAWTYALRTGHPRGCPLAGPRARVGAAGCFACSMLCAFCMIGISGTHCTWYFHLRRSGSRICPSTFVAARGPAPCVKAPDQPQQRPNDAPCLADIASTLLCVCGYFTARAALYSIKLVHLQHMKVLTEQVIVKPNTHNTSCRWPVAFREVSWVHGWYGR